MGLVFRLAELLIVILPLTGAIVAAARAFGSYRRRSDEQSRGVDRTQLPDPPAAERAGGNQAAQWRSIRRILDEHDRTDARWLEYDSTSPSCWTSR